MQQASNSKLKLLLLSGLVFLITCTASAQGHFSIDFHSSASFSSFDIPENVFNEPVDLLSGLELQTFLNETIVINRQVSYNFDLGVNYRLNQFGGVSYLTGLVNARLDNEVLFSNTFDFVDAPSSFNLFGWYNFAGIYADFDLGPKFGISVQPYAGIINYRIEQNAITDTITTIPPTTTPFTSTRTISGIVPGVGIQTEFLFPIAPSIQGYVGYSGVYPLQRLTYERLVSVEEPRKDFEIFENTFGAAHHQALVGIRWDIGLRKKVRSFVEKETPREYLPFVHTLQIEFKNTTNGHVLTLNLNQGGDGNNLSLTGGLFIPELTGDDPLLDSLQINLDLPKSEWEKLSIPTDAIDSGKSLEVEIAEQAGDPNAETVVFDKFYFKQKTKKNINRYRGWLQNDLDQNVRFSAETDPLPMLAVLAVVVVGAAATGITVKELREKREKLKDKDGNKCKWRDVVVEVKTRLAPTKVDVQLLCAN